MSAGTGFSSFKEVRGEEVEVSRQVFGSNRRLILHDQVGLSYAVGVFPGVARTKGASVFCETADLGVTLKQRVAKMEHNNSPRTRSVFIMAIDRFIDVNAGIEPHQPSATLRKSISFV